MTQDQTEKRLNWLDEQRRKDTDLLSLLDRRFTEAVERIEKQENQIKELSSEITRLSAVASQIRQFDDSLVKQREDFYEKLEDSDQSYTERVKHFENIRKKDYEGLSKSVTAMNEKIKDIDFVKDAIEVRKQEEIRQSHKTAEIEEKVENLLLKVDESERGLHTFEEARKMDTKRVTDLQSETTELRLKIDTIRGKQDSVEDRLRRAESRIDEINSSETKRRDIYTMWEEKQELRLVEFEKEWKSWQSTFEDLRKKSVEIDEKILKYDENYRSLVKVRSEMDKFIERIERRIAEISEIQRIGVERLKQEWTSFQADVQKQWNTYKLTNDEMWREHSRIHDRINEEALKIDEKLTESLEAIEVLVERDQSRVIDLFSLVREWVEEMEKKVGEIQ